MGGFRQVLKGWHQYDDSPGRVPCFCGLPCFQRCRHNSRGTAVPKPPDIHKAATARPAQMANESMNQTNPDRTRIFEPWEIPQLRNAEPRPRHRKAARMAQWHRNYGMRLKTISASVGSVETDGAAP